jgi:precorrin-2 dehydrogenase/sirohydrochlorin ferrochelatase
MFPLLLNLTGKRIIVVGCGAVGSRKLSALLEASATVRVIDPRPDLPLPPGVVHIRAPYQPEHLDGVALAFACATPEVNARVVADCHARGVWVNSATSPEEGDFALPAVVRRGELTLAVGTGGAAPALARRIRERWEAEFDGAFAEWVRILAEVRAEILVSVADEPRRRELLDGFADWPWLARLRAEGADTVRTAMLALIRQASGGGGVGAGWVGACSGAWGGWGGGGACGGGVLLAWGGSAPRRSRSVRVNPPGWGRCPCRRWWRSREAPAGWSRG